MVAEARRRNPEIPLSVDANAAYSLGDRDHLRLLDRYGLLMIEQPLAHDDLMDHAQLQRTLNTPHLPGRKHRQRPRGDDRPSSSAAAAS